jgi:hypothetical protein
MLMGLLQKAQGLDAVQTKGAKPISGPGRRALGCMGIPPAPEPVQNDLKSEPKLQVRVRARFFGKGHEGGILLTGKAPERCA